MDKLKYYDTKEWYKYNKYEFSKIEKYFAKNFEIPSHIIEDTICKMILCNHHQERENRKINFFKSFLMFYSIIGFFLVLSFFGKRTKKNHICGDVAFDLWDGGNHILYDEFYNILNKKYKIILLNFTKNNIIYSSKFNKHKYDVLNDKSEFNQYFLNKISFKIFKYFVFKFFFFYKISKKLNYDMVRIMVRIMKRIAVYETNIDGFRVKVLISAHDNSFDPLKYEIFKKNISSIFIIQNGYKQGIDTNCIHQDCLNYADYYVGFSDKNIDIQKGNFKNKLAWGSILIDQEKIKNKSSKKLYDVLFIEQFILDGKFGISEASYEKCLKLLCDFTIKYPQYKIAYRIRDRKNVSSKYLLNKLKEYESLLKNAQIIIDDNLEKTSYQAIIESDIIVHYASTLGIEALAFHKKVLGLYSDGYTIPVAFSKKDEIGMLIDYNQKKFEEKLLYLLENDNKVIEDYYNEKCQDTIQQKDNLHYELCKLIEKEISEAKSNDICC